MMLLPPAFRFWHQLYLNEQCTFMVEKALWKCNAHLNMSGGKTEAHLLSLLQCLCQRIISTPVPDNLNFSDVAKCPIALGLRMTMDQTLHVNECSSKSCLCIFPKHILWYAFPVFQICMMVQCFSLLRF